jgi:hypothetical protein
MGACTPKSFPPAPFFISSRTKAAFSSRCRFLVAISQYRCCHAALSPVTGISIGMHPFPALGLTKLAPVRKKHASKANQSLRFVGKQRS